MLDLSCALDGILEHSSQTSAGREESMGKVSTTQESEGNDGFGLG
jgi:hypothetical protein